MLRWIPILTGLATACGDDGGGDTLPTLDALYGTWVERTGDSYFAMQLTRSNLLAVDAAALQLFEGTSRADPTSRTGPYAFVHYDNRISALREVGQSSYEVRIDAFDGDRMTTLQGGRESETVHHYVREPGCPLVRDGAWMWSKMADGNDYGQISIALGPRGTALGRGGPSYPANGPSTFTERLGCGFTSRSLVEFGYHFTRIAHGLDGQPIIVGARNGDLAHARVAPIPATGNGLVVTSVPDVDVGRPFSIVVDVAGTTLISHSSIAAQGGLNVSSVAVDGTVTTARVGTANGFLAESVIALDASGVPHVVFEPNTDYRIYAASLMGGTWTATSTPIVPGIGRSVTGFVIGTDNSFHIAWTEYVNGSEEQARYSTNASGTWLTTALGPGRNPNVALDSQGHPHVIYESIPDRKPHLATNASGTWVDIIPESSDSPAPVDPLDPAYGFCAIAIDANDKIYLGFGDSWFGTNAY